MLESSMNHAGHPILELTDSLTTLQAQAGEIILLTGDSGSGKSLWLHRMAALIDAPKTMQVSIDGNGPDKSAVRMLFDRWPCVWLGQTVAQELIFGLRTQPAAEAIGAALAEWALSDISLDTEPQALNRIQSLRLSLTAMSLAKPALILLDNPTAALSQQDAHAVINDIANRAVFSNTIVVVACNRWHDWQSGASQIWQVTAPDALPQTGIQL